MKLYRAASTAYARHVIDHGFVADGSYAEWTEDEQAEFENLDSKTEKVAYIARINSDRDRSHVEYVVFRDSPPSGVELSRTAEMRAERTDDDKFAIIIDGGPTIVTDLGDFVLSIEVPSHVAQQHRIQEDEPKGWPFQEFYLPVAFANKHKEDSLIVYGYEPDEVTLYEVRPDLVGK